MPLSRYLIKNEYGLADPELYRAADKDDPEALLEGVAMAGLVGLLRQLGDLAEFAAEIFHNLHEEVMATAARGHGLLVRVQQLESEFPSFEKTLLSQTSHSSLLDNSGSEWHPNLRMEQNLITRGDLPRFVMDSYEECRAPPRLFILDKFDVAGAGACLKRYTDPSYFKVGGPENPESHREKKRKAKKKGSQVKNGDNTPQTLQKVHTRLHDLLHKETVENIINGPASRVKLKRRLNENNREQSYMEKFLKINSAELEVVHEISVSSAPLLLCYGSPRQEPSPKRSSYSSSSDIDDSLAKPPIDQLTEEAKYELSGVKRKFSPETYETFSPLHNHVDEKEIEVDRERKMEITTGDYQSDEITSDVENYMDALATIDSDIDADMQCRSKNDTFSSKQQPHIDANQANLPDSQHVESFMLTDNESISSSGELSELSYSDNSNLTKAVPSDDSISAEGIQSSDLSRVEDDHLLSEQPLVDENNTTPHLENICNDIHVTEADTSTYCCGIGEEQSSSCHTDIHPVSLSLNLQGSLIQDPSENSESNEEGSINNENREYLPHDLLLASRIPPEALKTLFSVSSAEKHQEYQDQVDTSPILRKTLETEKNNDVDITENATKGEPYPSDTETLAFKAPDPMDTIAEEPVTHSFDLHMDPLHLNNVCMSEQPESFVALGESQPEFSVLFEEHTELVVPHSEEPKMMVSLENDQFAVSHTDEKSQLLLLHTEEHNQSVVIHKEEQTPLVVSDTEMQLAEEQPQWPLPRAEEHPQLSSSQAAEQPQLTSSDKEEQLQSITLYTEERPISIASSAELQSHPLAFTDPCSVTLGDQDTIVIQEVVISSESSPSTRCLVNDSMEQTSLGSAEVISPDELQLPSMDNLKVNVNEADCGGHDSFIDRTTYVQHEFHSDTLNSEKVSNEFVPLFDESTETKDSKATSEASAACLMDDIYLAEEQDLSVLEESTSIVGPLHPVIEREHSLRPLDTGLLEERSQQTGTGTGTGLETETGTGLDDIYLVEKQDLSVVEELTSIVGTLHPVIEMEHSLQPLDKALLEERSQQTGTRTGLDDMYLVEEQDLSLVQESTSIVGPLHSVIEMEHSVRPLDKALLEERSQQTGTGTGLDTVLCNKVSNMESDTGMPADINEIMKTSVITISEQSGLDSACNSRIETPTENKVQQIVEQFEKELKSAEKVSPEAYFHKKQSTTSDCLYLEEQPSGSPKFAEVPMSEFSMPNHFEYVESQFVGQSMPMPTFPVKEIESPNFLDQEDPSIASEPSAHSLSFLPPSNAHKEVGVPSIGIFSSFDLPGPPQNMFDEMPPLPPLPPVQWRIPKVLLQNAPEGLERNLEQFDGNPLRMSQPSANLAQQLDPETKESTRMQFSTFSAIKDEVSNHECNLSPVSPVVSNHTEDFHSPDMAISSMAQPITDDNDSIRMPRNEEDSSSLTNASKILQERPIECLDGLAPEMSPENEKSLALNVTMEEVDPRETALTSTNMDDGKPQPVSSNSQDHSMFAPQPELAYVKSNGGFQKKIPRPRNPLIDAVVALDKTKLRKVTERIRPPSSQKVDERDTFLEQIRTRSFNLKPTAATRPSIQGPKTNRNVAAILEKANSIRQALAGSDDDDDGDSWSDS